MTPGPAMRTARALPRNRPVPMAPPIAIMLSWAEVSWRSSCSPCSMAPSVVFIRGAGAAGGVEGAQQLDGGVSRILDAVADAYGEIYAAAGPELAGFRLLVNGLGMYDSVAFENENAFFIGVEVERGFARGNPAGELGHLAAAEVGVDQIAEDAVL